LFPEGLLNEVPIMAIVLSSDGHNDTDILAVNAASAALSISDIPFNGPIACCRIARVNNEFVLNPVYSELEKSDLDIVVVINDKGIMMLESKAKEISEEDFLEAVKFGSQNLKSVLVLQQEFQKQNGKPKAQVQFKVIPVELQKKVEDLALLRLIEIYKLLTADERVEQTHILSKELEEKLIPEGFTPVDIKIALQEVEKKQVRNKILKENTRLDGRGFKEIRPITCEVSVLPRTHGSALFTRGQTQSLAVTTLGTGEDEQLIEALEGEKYKSFMLHYSFPPFSVGETAPVRGPGRREIGHGALAEKAIQVVMPSKEKFPYTIRVVSEILESNGSSSMATVCAATLSLMDAGVPIKDTVAGIAIGLIKEGLKSIILTDIAGLEDHFGDMDFKVAGTKTGVTAVQLDLKIDGIDLDLLKSCLQQAKEARMAVLEKMNSVLASPRQELSTYAPRIEILKINTDKIGVLIGPSGKTVKSIIAATGTTIDIQDDGTVLVGSTNSAKSREAIEMIKAITEDIEVGRVYIARVKKITNFGAFCEIAPGKEGLVHISELADRFVKNVEDVVKVGEEIKVKVTGIDEMGRINLSKKQVDKEI
ncbi:MAG: polyribonucleotide nucleotidyltransferase, partial [Candidatus Omnitrophica bacterium]|nr:polyribonucleotide nucleotidyltransferase [Candidatus Omnitrophota bacterium]